MKASKILILSSTILIAGSRFLDPAYNINMKAGDWNYYLKGCTRFPNDHPFIFIILHLLNLATANPKLTVTIVAIFGFSLNYFLIFELTARLTDNIHIGFISCFISMISPMLLLGMGGIALKNLYGLIFFFATLILLLQFQKSRSKRILIGLGITSFLTVSAHTIGTFLLLIVLLVYLIRKIATPKEQNKKPIFLLLSLASFTTLLTLFLSNFRRNQKIFTILFLLSNGFFSVILVNIARIVGTPPMFYFWISYILSLILIFGNFRKTKKINPVVLGLLVCAGILFHLGPTPYSSRFFENVSAIASPIFGVTLGLIAQHFRAVKRKVKELRML